MLIKNPIQHILHLSLALLCLFGFVIRFSWVDWSKGANLHPDEYGLTNTLTQLQIPETIDAYFNTRLSPLSSYSRYDLLGLHVGNGPDNGMRWGQWPMIIIRFVAEQTGNTGYNELRLVGRTLSALMDSLAILFIILIGKRLYNLTIGLLAAVFSSFAVMQIQQSHFMTVDNFATLFTTIAIYAGVRIAQRPLAQLNQPSSGDPTQLNKYQPVFQVLAWYLLFGLATGMALASRINLLPLAGMVVIAGFISIADLRLRSKQDLWRILICWSVFTIIAFLTIVLTFRITQPMSFRQPTRDTSIFHFHPNPDWVENMKRAQIESGGIGAGPPGDQWAQRTIILFPWINMVLWGMGLPLGILSWTGLGIAAWRVFRYGERWRSHLLPLIWSSGFFFFMATRWVMSMRYFLPVYPFLTLFAAWALFEVWQWYADARKDSPKHSFSIPARAALCAAVSAVAIGGTFVWAIAFVRAVYQNDHTRVQATQWIFQNIPGPFQLQFTDAEGETFAEPIATPDGLLILPDNDYLQPFTMRSTGRLSSVTLPRAVSDRDGELHIAILSSSDMHSVLDEAVVPLDAHSGANREKIGHFRGAELAAGREYFLHVSVTSREQVQISRVVISNENWDEGLPFPFDHRDPFGQLYRGVTMEVRWWDDENKRQMFVQTLAEADYIILPSQRGIWTTCRIPKTYPMTMAYYHALFEGKLGFDLVATFSAPIRLGPLQISDVGGTWAVNNSPPLPLFNNSLLAAEEAFSVYDHPPVWIFKKGANFNIEAVHQFFYSLDLSKVEVQSPRNASAPSCVLQK
jgi:hypothetical protein